MMIELKTEKVPLDMVFSTFASSIHDLLPQRIPVLLWRTRGTQPIEKNAETSFLTCCVLFWYCYLLDDMRKWAWTMLNICELFRNGYVEVPNVLHMYDIIWSTDKLLVSCMPGMLLLSLPFQHLSLRHWQILLYWLTDEFLANGTFARKVNS